MSLLHLPTTETATDEVKEIFKEIEKTFGSVPNGISLWSVNARALRAQWESIKHVLAKDPDTQKLHTMIRYLVSNEGECTYCIGFNGGMLMNFFGMTEKTLKELREKPSSAPLNEKNKALLVFAMKSIIDAKGVKEADIDLMKKLGITEMEMFDIVHAAAHMLVVNTLFKTFKVEQDF